MFETTFIVNASLDDAQVDAVIAKVQDLVTKNDGEVVSIQRWGRKRLAYTIQKKNNGFYVCVEFSGPGEIVGKLDRHFHLEENVLRFLTVKLTKQALKARQTSPVAPPLSMETATSPEVGKPSPTEIHQS